MAPKGGKGGGSGGKSGVSGYSNATAPLYLKGYDWQNKLIIGWLALAGIVTLVLIVCLILQTRFRWVRDVKVDRLRNSGYKIAVISMICLYGLDITDTVLREERYTTTRLYYIARIISNFLWRFADILILPIIYRTIAESSLANLARKLAALHTWLVIPLILLSLSAFGTFIAIEVGQIRESTWSSSTHKAYDYISVAYYAIYLIAALLAGLESLTVMLRARTKQTLIMLTFVTSFLVLRSLFNLVNIVLVVYSDYSSTFPNFYSAYWAVNFIGTLSDMFIYGGVALIGFLTFRKGASQSGKYIGGASNGAHDTQYSPVGGWAR